MAAIVCTKCGQKGHSKCPFCRSVFAGGVDVKMLEQFTHLTKSADNCVIVSFRSYSQESTHYELLQFVADCLKGMTQEQITQVACLHDFVLAPGQVSDISCGHKGAPVAVE